MNPKPRDIPYCGVDVEKLKQAKPKINEEMLRRYAFYQKERTKIYEKKEILGLPSPWTKNPMLAKFKFTMTKRWLDRQSKNLIDNILNNDEVSYDNKLLNSFIFRMINRYDPLFSDFTKTGYFDFSKNLKDWYEDLNYAREEFSKNSEAITLTSDAYILNSLMNYKRLDSEFLKSISEKEPLKIDKILAIIDFTYMNKDRIVAVSELDSPHKIVAGLCGFTGIQKFISYQIFSDWSYITEFPFSDKEFAEIGPGTERGLRLVFEDFDGLTLPESVFYLKDNLQNLCDDIGVEWDIEGWFHFLQPQQRYWGCGDICNSMCEFDKSQRIWTEELQEINKRRVRKYSSQSKIQEW
jgi:hypothetical protein